MASVVCPSAFWSAMTSTPALSALVAKGVVERVRVDVDPGVLVEKRLRASGIKGVG